MDDRIISTFRLLVGKIKINHEIVYDSVAQLVEQLTLNQRAESSSLSGVTNVRPVLFRRVLLSKQKMDGLLS
jgi:hypothetical protein